MLQVALEFGPTQRTGVSLHLDLNELVRRIARERDRSAFEHLFVEFGRR